MHKLRFLSFFLSLFLILSLLGGCATEPIAPLESTPSAPTQTEPTEDSQIPPPFDEPAPSGIEKIADGGFTDYRVVIDDAISEETSFIIRDLLADLKIDGGIRFDTVTDLSSSRDKEILLGLTDRAESQQLKSSLSGRGYSFAYFPKNHRLAMVGTSEQQLIVALQYFLETYVDDSASRSYGISIPLNLSYQVSEPIALNSVTVYGTPLSRFRVVVSDIYDEVAYYAALNLIDYFQANAEITLPLVTDATQPMPYEFLVGETTRSESQTSATLKDQDYLIVRKNDKIVLQGADIYVGAAFGKIVTDYLQGDGLGRDVHINDLPSTETVYTYEAPTTAKNSVLMIGDGMGFNHINLALNAGMGCFWASRLPTGGEAITNSVSGTTDSAAAGTALATGYKTVNGYIGKDRNGKDIQNLRELAQSVGAKTAVLTTDAINGATPSSFLAHNISRSNAATLSQDIQKLIDDKKIDACVGSIGNELTDEVRAALSIISDSSAPFFMMVEEGHIDKRAHSNDADGVISTVNRFNDAILYVIQFVFCHPDTVLFITADHETGGLVPDSYSPDGYRFTSGDHTPTNVPIYAIGAGVDRFDGVAMQNTEIPHFLATIFGNNNFGDPNASWAS